MSVPLAEYPETELAKYKIDVRAPENVEGAMRVRLQTGRHRVQTANTASTLLRKHISERSWTVRNWYRHIHWKNFLIVVVVPTIGVMALALCNVAPVRQTIYFAVFNYVVTILAINIVYHRYWAHGTLSINNDKLVIALATLSCGGGVTSAKNWCSSHRAHHRCCDVADQDPHNIRRGFLFSHFGWMILIHNPKVVRAIKESKLDELPNENIVQWQLENYLTLFFLVGLVVPCVICGWFWDDYMGGLLYAGFCKIILVQNAIFALNSFGHTAGTQPYNDTKSPRNNLLLNLVTLGEGNLNFHHEFPVDYRNGPELLAFDPTKWLVRIFYLLGLVLELRHTSKSIIDKSYVQQQQKLIDNKRSQLNWGIPIDLLPVLSPDEFRRLASSSPDRYLVVVSGIIHDVTPFAKDHPGGLPLIKAAHGRDTTSAFNGAVYSHSNAARNLLATMRIGVLGGSETLFWKQQRIENKSVPIDNDSGGNRIVRSGAQVTINKLYGGTAGAA